MVERLPLGCGKNTFIPPVKPQNEQSLKNMKRGGIREGRGGGSCRAGTREKRRTKEFVPTGSKKQPRIVWGISQTKKSPGPDENPGHNATRPAEAPNPPRPSGDIGSKRGRAAWNKLELDRRFR